MPSSVTGCTHSHTGTETHKHTHTETQTDTHMHRDTHSQRHSEAHTYLPESHFHLKLTLCPASRFSGSDLAPDLMAQPQGGFGALGKPQISLALCLSRLCVEGSETLNDSVKEEGVVSATQKPFNHFPHPTHL